MNEFLKQYQQFAAQKGKNPKVRVSKEWYEKQLQSTFVLRNNKSDNQLHGIPVEFDENVSTFELVED